MVCKFYELLAVVLLAVTSLTSSVVALDASIENGAMESLESGLKSAVNTESYAGSPKFCRRENNSFVAPGLNVFRELSPSEIAAIEVYLYKQTSLQLVPWTSAK